MGGKHGDYMISPTVHVSNLLAFYTVMIDYKQRISMMASIKASFGVKPQPHHKVSVRVQLLTLPFKLIRVPILTLPVLALDLH